MRDAAAVAFERQFLAWLHIHFGVEPVERAGTNAFWWTFPHNGADVCFVILGQTMNSARGPAPGTSWLLRIEEEEGTGFAALVEPYFQPGSSVRRRMQDGRSRVQFNSKHLVRPFEDQREGTGLPSAADPGSPAAPPAAYGDLRILLWSQTPVITSRHAAGNLKPCGAFMNLDGRIYDEALDEATPAPDEEGAINRLAFKYREGLRDGRILAGAVFMHVGRDGDRFFVVNAPGDEPSALAAYVQHASADAIQMIMAYERSDDREAAPNGWKYAEPELRESPGLPVMYQFGVRWFAPGPEYSGSAVRQCAIDPAGRAGLVVHEDGSAWTWDLDNADRNGPLAAPELKGTAHAVATQPCRLLQGDASGNLVLHNVASGERVREIETGLAGISACALSSNGRTAVAGTTAGELVFCDLEWAATKMFRFKDALPIAVCAVTPDGTKAITVSDDGYTTLWRAGHANFEPVADRASSLTHARMAATSANGRYAVAAGGQLFVVWDLERGTPGPLTDAGAEIDACAISPNGQFLLLGLRSGMIRLWDEVRGASRQDLDSSDLATAIAFAPDGGSALIGHASGGVLFVRLLPV